MDLNQNSFTFLGTGASLGIPIIGCTCATCQSLNPKNKRWRTSALLNIKGKKILIDAGPDFRSQALCYKIYSLAGVILTHSHHDHTGGVDDLRIYYFKNKAPLAILGSKKTTEDLLNRFHFMFKEQPNESHKRLTLQVLKNEQGEEDFLGIKISYFTYLQLGTPVTGLKIGKLAYLTDIKEYLPSIFDFLKGVEILIISALRYNESTMHFTIAEALAFIAKVKPKTAYLTHLSHEIEQEKSSTTLPENVYLAYDGLTFNF